MPVICFSAMWLALPGCDRGSKTTASDEEPAPLGAGILRVSQPVQEQLGLAVRAATRREVAGTLSITGWLEAEPGREVVVKAPLAGFVTEAPGRRLPRLGQAVDKRERLVSLRVFVTPQEMARLRKL